MWLFSLKGVSVLALIILPSIVLLSQIVFDELRSFFITGLKNGTISIEYINSQIYIYYIIIYFQYSVYFTWIVYPLFPLIYSSERYFRRRGYENTVIEYRRLKTAIYFLLPIAIFSLIDIVIIKFSGTSIEHILLPQIFPGNISTSPEHFGIRIFFYLKAYLTIIGVSVLLKTIFLISKKDFRFYFAKACIKFVSNEKDEVEKITHLIDGLKSYNKYLRKQLRLQINDFKISSKISDTAIGERFELIEKVCKAFEGDKLEPINNLSIFFKDPDTEQFLTKAEESSRTKLQEWGSIAGKIISTVIAIIGALAAASSIRLPGLH